MLAIIQPSCCSSCRQPYKSSLADCQRVLDCGCTLCGICSESQLLSFGGTCPSCGHAFSTRNTHTTTKSWSHPRVMADDITAQEARCQYYRNELFQLEREIANTPSPSTQDPLPGDNTDDLAVLSDDSLAITSSDDDEYTNTKYAVVAKRLAALRMRVKVCMFPRMHIHARA